MWTCVWLCQSEPKMVSRMQHPFHGSSLCLALQYRPWNHVSILLQGHYGIFAVVI
jgi:hypothetical protein